MDGNSTKVLGLVSSIAACVLLAAPVYAWDPVRDLTGRTVKQHVERSGKKLERSAKKFADDPVDYILSRPESLLADLCAAVPRTYEGTLRGQVGRWKELPPELIDAVQSQYAVNLRGIRYAENIRTSNGAAQCFGSSIYFPTRIDLRNRGDLFWMLHELEHSVQFQRSSYGKSGKLCEYMMKAAGSGFDHDSIDMERAADRKAEYLIDYANWVMSGGAIQQRAASGRLAKNEIWIRNETDWEVSFLLQTQTISEVVMLPPFSQQVFRGHPQNSWFNIAIQTYGQEIRYSLDGGTNQHIDWNQNGLLDVFWSN